MLQPETFRYQSSLASYCRGGHLREIKGINQNNVKQYRRLVYNVVDDMLQSAFPITYDFVDEDEWNYLVNDFFSSHSCQSPQVWYMPKEFYGYLERAENPIVKKYPFLLELLWFEWLEVELFMMADKTASYSKQGSLLTDVLILNPEHHFQYFQYPVHLKKPSEISVKDQGHYYLVLHRDPDLGSVSFTEVAAPVLRLLELLSSRPLKATNVIEQVGTEFGFLLNEEMKQYAFQFFQKALSMQLILGYQKI